MSKALIYHAKFPPGKIGIQITKNMKTASDLALAYTPGVADPCKEIDRDSTLAYNYTNKGNLVAVISNGTAVLGLGTIKAVASKPVMEGKAALFKFFGGIDSFDIEINETNPQKIIDIVKAISPTFGGINLEDIKAPECFEIEKKLIEELDIPVFHDDQHGTAIIVAAAVKNALELQLKDLSLIKVVVSGAGAGAISTLKLLCSLGLNKKNLYVFDSKGLMTKSRSDLNSYKEDFAIDCEDMDLSTAMKKADMFIGLSKEGIVNDQMIKDMADNPIVFALANPNPEILPPIVHSVRSDAIVATGRSDFPNQVNNAICFPHLFRGALDVGAKKITESMKVACVNAIASLAKENVLEDVLKRYGLKELNFGRDYIIPSPFDRRLCFCIAKAVAQDAMNNGIATRPISNMKAYEDQINQRLDPSFYESDISISA